MGRREEIVENITKGLVPARDMRKLSKELGRLEIVLEAHAALAIKEEEAKDLEEIMRLSCSGGAEADGEMYTVAKEEHGECVRDLARLRLKLENLLVPRDETDSKNALLEVRSGSGGDEAAEFARSLFDMYRRFAALKGWAFEELHSSETDLGGYREAAAAIRGEDVYGALKFENGVHRVQRVPLNSTRLHTSAASVVVMMEAEDVDVTLDPRELRFEAFRSSGAGGQHVNTTESAVRVTHIPTGLTASIQDERSQHRNKAKALSLLRSRVFQARHEERLREEAVLRSSAVGTGDRSERIRTYHFPQDRITDHRVHVTFHGWVAMMKGELLDDFQDALKRRDQASNAKAAGM